MRKRQRGLAYDWFTAWVEQNLALTVTFVNSPDVTDLLVAFRADFTHTEFHTFMDEAADPPGTFRVRVGDTDGWAYAVEHFTTHGGDPGVLEQLSGGGREALVLSYTQTVSCFLYVKGEVLLNGFDTIATDIRWGTDQHRFDAEMAAAGFFGPEPACPASGARLVEMITGIEITQPMLERSLRSARVPPPWESV